MRAPILAFCTACVLTAPAFASSVVEPRPVEKLPVDVGDRYPERWQGRQHYLFDETYTGPQTDGRGSPDARECSDVTIQLKRTDGVSVTRRSSRCDE